MKYQGDLKDLVTYSDGIVYELFAITFQGNIYRINNKVTHSSYALAERALRNHIYIQFCQGHYFHKNNNNTFTHEKGWERNSGHVGGSEAEFKVMAKKMTKQLLEDKVFIISPLVIKN